MLISLVGDSLLPHARYYVTSLMAPIRPMYRNCSSAQMLDPYFFPLFFLEHAGDLCIIS